MAVTAPPALAASPALAIQRGDRTTFSDRLDANIQWQITVAPQMVALAGNVAANATETYSNSIAAAGSATAAAASASTAASTAGAALWVSGQAYGAGVSAISLIDFLTYRRRSAGSGVIDPKIDTANWSAVLPPGTGQVLYMNSNFGGF